jgi:alpha-L-rhamnosidase
MLNVDFDGVFGDKQLVCNVTIAVSVRDQAKNLNFAWCKCVIAIMLRQLRGNLGRHSLLSIVDLTNDVNHFFWRHRLQNICPRARLKSALNFDITLEGRQNDYSRSGEFTADGDQSVDAAHAGSAIILSPWSAYTFYGDEQILRDNYDAIVAYANYLQTRAHDNIISYGLGDWYDIGPDSPGKSQLTGEGMTATAIYYQDLTDLARIATILDKPANAAQFASRAAAVKASINAHFFHPEADNYDRGSQTANAMALALGLVAEDHRAGVLSNLIADIHRHQNHATAGDVGFHYVVRALTDSGRSDVLYDMLTRTDSPSYGYQLSHGATALTEAWDANPSSSQDHFMLGHAEEWLYRGLAGIDFDLDRERSLRIWIHPQIVGDVHFASASYESVLGNIATHWQRDGDTLQLDVTIPPGTTATISIPQEFSRSVVESGHGPHGDNGVLSVRDTPGATSLVVGSGSYHFVAQR